MDIQIRIDELREKMKMAENSLKFYAVNGGEDEAEYQRLLDVARSARTEFLRNLNTLTNTSNRLVEVHSR